MADTTTYYGFPYQEPTDPPDGASLGQDLAEAIEDALKEVDDRVTVTETDIAAIEASASTTDPGTVQSGFTVTTAYGVTALGGKIVHTFLELANTSNLSVTSFNIADVSCYVFDAAYRPDSGIYLPALITNSGSIIGNAQLGPDGNVLIQTANATINAGSAIRMSWTFLKA